MTKAWEETWSNEDVSQGEIVDASTSHDSDDARERARAPQPRIDNPRPILRRAIP